jgi:AraC-like DNA-binding protein
VKEISLISRGSTRGIPPPDRVAYWEEYTRKFLVQMACSSFDDRGLEAEQSNLGLQDLHLAVIRGNAHAVQRTPAICSAAPKDAIYANLVISGRTMVLDNSECLTARAGDLIVYDSQRPYLLGFPGSMRHIMVDIPRDLYYQQVSNKRIGPPLILGSGSVAESRDAEHLQSLLTAVAETPARHDAADVQQLILNLISSLVSARTGNEPAAPLHSARRLAAERYIDQHLHDCTLTPSRVAGHLNISVRQVGRLFEPTGSSPARFIHERRLLKAREQLTLPQYRHVKIADLAYLWGFSSHAHFARAFRDYFGMTPSEARASDN